MSLDVGTLQELVRLLEQQPRWRQALREVLWKEEDVVQWLRDRLPRLLQEDPRLSAELVGILAQTLSPRSELVRVLEEIRALREDMDRRFEAMDQRFRALQEEMDRRFLLQAEILREHRRELRYLRVGSASSGTGWDWASRKPCGAWWRSLRDWDRCGQSAWC